MSSEPVKPAVPPAPKIAPNKRHKSRIRPVLSLDDSPAGVINNVIAREILDPSPEVEDAVDEMPLAALAATVRGLNHGHSLGELETHAKRLSSHAQDKADLVTAILQAHELDRLVVNLQGRAILERHQNRAIRRGDLSTVEVLAFLDRISTEVEKGITLLKKSNPALDCITIIEKVNSAKQETEKAAQTKFAGTTPQGREIIRRSLFSMLAAGKRAAEDIEVSVEERTGGT